MATVTINGNSYITYADVEKANEYLLASINYPDWEGTSADDKARSLVTSTRVLDRQKWKPEYDTFEKRILIEGIVDASIELAAMLASGDTEFVSNANTSSQTKRLKAGSAEIEYFGPQKNAQRFANNIMELIGQYLVASGADSFRFGGSFVSGVDGKSMANRNFGYTSGI